jgi:hypothetical protein
MTSLIVAVLVWLFRESPGAPARDRARTRSHALAGAAVIAGIAAGVFLSAWISTKQTNPTQPSPANAFVRDPERAPGMARTPSAAQ